MAALDPRATKFHSLGNSMARDQKYNEAITNFLKAVEIEPGYAAAFYHLAEAYEAKKMEDEAYSYYVKAIGLNSSFAISHIESGLYTMLSGPLGKAVVEYKKRQDGHVEDKDAPPPAIASPKEGSPVDLATRPAVEKPRGQKGLKPLKLLIEPARLNISSEAWSVEKVTAIVLGDKDIPVAEGAVAFKVKNDPDMQDAFIAIKPELANAEKGPQQLKLKTDGEGRVSVYFRRSRIIGLNRLDIHPDGLTPGLFEDFTHSSPISRADISPRAEQFRTAQVVNFQVKAFDRFNNAIVGLELALSIQMKNKKTGEWDVVDNANIRTGEGGALTHKFSMPTRGHAKCRLEVACKPAGFLKHAEFNVVPGKANAMLFIPSGGETAPGTGFTLKVRLLDEYDNPIDGIEAGIKLKESSGGEWNLGPQTSNVTGADGSVAAVVTPPDSPGATAVFTVESQHLTPEIITFAKFETTAAYIRNSASAPETNASENDTMRLEKSVLDEFAGEFDSSDDLIPTPQAAMPGAASLDDTFGDSFGSAGAGAADPFAHPGAGTDASFMTGGMAALESLELGEAAPAPPAAGDEVSYTDTAYADDSYKDPFAPGEHGVSTPAEAPSRIPDDAAFGWDSPPAGDTAPLAAAAEDYGLEDYMSPAPQSQAPASNTVVIQAERELTCQAGEMIPVRARLTDDHGSPISAGVKAVFTITGSGSPGADSQMVTSSGIPKGRKLQVEPDLAGEVSTIVRVSDKCGGFSVEISVNGVSEKVAVNVAPGAPETIVLETPEPEADPGGEIEITARALDKFDNPVPGEFVAISLEDYTGNPGVLHEQPENMTDNNGEVKVGYQASKNPGDSVTITASNPNIGGYSVKSIIITTRNLSPMPEAHLEDAEHPGMRSHAEHGNESFGRGASRAGAPAAPYSEPAAALHTDETTDYSGSDSSGADYKKEYVDEYKDAYAAADSADGYNTTEHGETDYSGTNAREMDQGVQPPVYEEPETVYAEPAMNEEPYYADTPAQPGASDYYSEPPAAPPAPAGYPQDQGFAPPPPPPPFAETDTGYDETDAYHDEEVQPYLADENTDPYAVPVFNVKVGKKPGVDTGALLKKMVWPAIIGGVIVFLALFGLFGYKVFMYQYYFTQGVKKFNEGNYLLSNTMLLKATHFDPKKVDPLEKLAQIHVETAINAKKRKDLDTFDREINKAIGNLIEVLQIQPNNVDSMYNLGDAYELKQNFCSALTQYEKILKADPGFQLAEAKKSDLVLKCNMQRGIRSGRYR